MNRKREKTKNKQKKKSEREVFIELESVVKDMVSILSRISLRNISRVL